MYKEKRMIDFYEVTTSVWFDGKEYILAEDKNDTSEMPYMTCVGTRNDILVSYSDVLISDDYVELFQVFADRLSEQAKQFMAERAKTGVSTALFTTADCVAGGLEFDIEGKVIILKPSALSPEYRTAINQLQIATSGFGCNPKSSGRAVYCTNLYTGAKYRYNRHDVAGVADISRLPEWARKKIKDIES